MHHSLLGSSAHGIVQARILEWVAVPSSSGSSCSRIKFVSLMFPSLTSRFFTSSTTWEAHPKVQQTANESNQLSAQQTASKSNQLSALRKIRYYSYLLISLGLEKVKVRVGRLGWGRHVNSRTFHFNVWQNSLRIKKNK